jgi:hypothetical protein
MRRLQHLAFEVKRSPQAFSGDQVLSLRDYFSNNYIMAIHILDHHILGLTCQQVCQIISGLPNDAQKIDGFRVCSEHITDPGKCQEYCD